VLTSIALRAILHDPEVYPNPEDFIPERHLTADGTVKPDKNLQYAFGFGRRYVVFALRFSPYLLSCERRICTGRHLVDSSMWMYIVSILFAFTISDAEDMNGNALHSDTLKYSDTLVR
jgi:hypothetical protein